MAQPALISVRADQPDQRRAIGEGVDGAGEQLGGYVRASTMDRCHTK
jgi:hypothetical protein